MFLDIPTLRFVTHLRRLGASTLLASSLLASTPETAHASEAVDRPSCSTSIAAQAAAIPLAGAFFSAHRVEEGLRWDARFIIDMEAAFDFRGGTIPFALPLPAGEHLLPAPGIEAIVEGDRVVGLCVAREALAERSVLASFLQPVALAADKASELGTPVASSGAVQIVDTSIGERRIELADDGPLQERFERHVGYVAPRSIGSAAREEARRLAEVRARVTTSPIYVRGEDVRATGGLTGRVVDPSTRAKRPALGIGVLFVGVVAALVVAARRLRHSASVERADALLAAEIDTAAKKAR